MFPSLVCLACSHATVSKNRLTALHPPLFHVCSQTPRPGRVGAEFNPVSLPDLPSGTAPFSVFGLTRWYLSRHRGSGSGSDFGLGLGLGVGIGIGFGIGFDLGKDVNVAVAVAIGPVDPSPDAITPVPQGLYVRRPVFE